MEKDSIVIRRVAELVTVKVGSLSYGQMEDP